MKIGGKLLTLALMFCLGFCINSFYTTSAEEMPFSTQNNEINSPYDRIKENQIQVYSDKIVIDIKDATWATYIDTNSMDPVLDKGANGLEITPKSPKDLYIGDIVAYDSTYVDGLVVHRIININKDEQGIYFTLKGDNNPEQDPEKVRFNQIKYVLIGVIY